MRVMEELLLLKSRTQYDTGTNNLMILPLLGKMNTRANPLAGYFEENSKRTDEDIQNIINELYTAGIFDPDFLIKVSFRQRYVQTVKQWMKMLYDKIIAYTGENEFIINAQVRLSDLPSGYELVINDLKPKTAEYFMSDNELRAGIEIGKIIEDLLGTFTIRLIFMQMLTIYEGKEGKFKIAINNREGLDKLTKYVQSFNFLASTQKPRHGLGEASLRDHLFSIFTQRSSFALPTGKDVSPGENNEWELGYTQIPFIKETLTISGDQKTFDQEISGLFYLKFNSQPTETKHQKVKKFCKSSYKIVKVLEDLIVKKIDNDGNIIDKKGFKNKIMERICFEYFKTHTMIYGRRTIRYNVEEMTRTTHISNIKIRVDYSEYGEEPRYYTVQLFREYLLDDEIITWWREPSYFDNLDIKRQMKTDESIMKLLKDYDIDIEKLFEKIKE